MRRGNAAKKCQRFHAPAKNTSDYQQVTKPPVAASRQTRFSRFMNFFQPGHISVARKSLYHNELTVFRVNVSPTLKTANHLIKSRLYSTARVSETGIRGSMR